MRIKLFLLLLIIFLIGSCGSKKKIIKTEKTAIQKYTTKTRDSVFVFEKSLPITEDVSISLSTGNNLTDSIVMTNLQGFSVKKNSGKNRLSIRYDKSSNSIKINTLNQGSETTKEKTSSKSATENTTKEIKNSNVLEKTGFGWRFYILLLCIALVIGMVVSKKIKEWLKKQ